MWARLTPEVKRLWIGFGVLFAAGNAFKAVTWYSVQRQTLETSALAHEDAARQLRESRESALKYKLPPLAREKSL